MKILITIGMVIVFISVFFMLFTFDTVVKRQLACMISDSSECTRESAFSFVFGMLVIGFFVLINVGVIYIIFTNVTRPTGIAFTRKV